MTQNPATTANAEPEIPSLPPGVKTSTFENGLTVIVREDHSAPVVSAQAWCMAGSIHEGKWLGAGMSHVLEHMLFKGTTSRPGSRIDQEVQEAGGYMNAYTSFDRTVYHIEVPNTGTRVAIDILCDVMQYATLPPEEMEKEKQVIVREMDMNIDDPNRRAGRRLFETAYIKSPYRFTVIGYPDIFHELKAEDIRAYYHEKYAPNNVFFVVAGDVNSQQVVEQIRAAYAHAKAKAAPPVVLPQEPRQLAAREIIEEAPIELGYFHVAWHIPELSHPDVPVLDVLAALLGNGRSSRLYRQVRESKALVHAIDAWTYNPGAPGLFGISATSDSEKFSGARDAALAEVEQLKTSHVPAEELSKAVKQFVAGTLATRKTMQGQAQDLGANWLAANDLNFSERYLAAVKKVTSVDLRRVAQSYLTPENRTIYGLLATGTAPTTGAAIESATDHPIHKYELPNGLRLLLKEDHRLPFVQFRAAFRGGVLVEDSLNNGVTQLMGKLLLKGTTTRSAEEIAKQIESVGGSLDSYGGNNSFGVNAEVMSEDFATGLNLLSDVLINPSFPVDPFERERDVQLAGIRAQKDQLLQSASKAMRRTLFGEAAYGLDPLGTEESVQRLKIEQVKSFQASMAVPNNCVLAIFGDIAEKAALAAVEQAFHSWQPGPKSFSTIADRDSAASGSIKRVTEERDKKQAVLIVGYRGATLYNPDRYPLELIQESCSDLGSRLFVRVREKLGLAYYVGAQNFAGLVPGYFAFYVGTMPEKAEQVEKELLSEAELLRLEGLTEAELKRAKAKIIGQRKISRQDLGALAMTTALDELYGLGYAHNETEDALYEAVTLEQVRSVARKYLKPDAFVVAVVRPPRP
jgi:zinc protease